MPCSCNSRWRFSAALGAWAALALALALPVGARAQDLAVVAHRSVPVDNLELIELRKLFLGDRQFWSSGEPVVLLVRAPPAPERAALLKNLCRMTEAQYKQHWIAKVFRAEAAASPKLVLSDEMAMQLVGSLPGALTVIRTPPARADLKLLRINGRLPGEPGYPLRSPSP